MALAPNIKLRSSANRGSISALKLKVPSPKGKFEAQGLLRVNQWIDVHSSIDCKESLITVDSLIRV